MAVINYGIYKISLNLDSEKTQGLRTGDIVRRQFFTGTKVVYSLMCVLSYGVDEITVEIENEDGTTSNVKKAQPWFVGALLEGDEPVGGEILDFARVTNLFDTNRSGALYLTASDEYSPFMDVIDGIGKNCSLCWPENLLIPDFPDSQSQYNVEGGDDIACAYQRSYNEYNRILNIHRLQKTAGNICRLRQSFYEYLDDTQTLIVSYKIKTSGPAIDIPISIGYTTRTEADEAIGNRTDGSDSVHVTENWEYKIHVITIENSGRHLRDFRMDFSDLDANTDLCICDFNIIRLSSLSNFADASQTRIGKLNGLVDPVFGRMSGYGAFLQKIFASQSAHISGTLTAGDENGFASTFYAGKIHKNAFINSLNISFSNQVSEDNNITNPTGIGSVYVSDEPITMFAQSRDWLNERVGKRYTFSFWVYSKAECQIGIKQNDSVIGAIQIDKSDIHCWQRVHVTFDLLEPDNSEEDLSFTLAPAFTVDSEDEQCVEIFYISAPQLEAGENVTQYQPTDSTLSYTDDYGAWFNRGGIGGTIQNPLLKLNPDGSIQSNNNSFLMRHDGSGHIASGHIYWDANGDMHFKDVTLAWEDLADDAKKELSSKSIKITGPDTFTLLGDESGSDLQFAPSSIVLTLEENNLESNSSQRFWYYMLGGEPVRIPNANGKTLTILPDASFWGKNESTLTIKCVVNIGEHTYIDTFTLKKQYIVGYTVEVTSQQGQVFKNGLCDTTLQANVYYQGKLVAPSYVEDNFTLLWKKYHLPDLDNEVVGWWEEQTDENGNVIQEAIDRGAQEIHIKSTITGRDLYICELQNGGAFPYSFPVIFS